MAGLQEGERELLVVDNTLQQPHSARSVQREASVEIAAPQRSNTEIRGKMLKRSVTLLVAGCMLACVIVAAGMHLRSVPSNVEEGKSANQAMTHTQQLYDPWRQQCVDMGSARVGSQRAAVVGRCQCNCEWAHRGGLNPSGCAVHDDNSCCQACCCGSQTYRQANSFAARRYNCLDDYADWRRAWSEAKQDFCCRAHGRGCGGGEMNLMQTTHRYNDDRYYNDDRHDSRYGAIRYDDHPTYDCEAGYSNWRNGWSVEKKSFCCDRYDMACEYNYLWWIGGFLVAAVVIAGIVWLVKNNQK